MKKEELEKYISELSPEMQEKARQCKDMTELNALLDVGGIGIMSAYNCIGSWWCGGSKAALTTLLREEWGFHGVVVTDYAGSDYMATNIGLRAGNDMWFTPSQ